MSTPYRFITRSDVVTQPDIANWKGNPMVLMNGAIFMLEISQHREVFVEKIRLALKTYNSSYNYVAVMSTADSISESSPEQFASLYNEWTTIDPGEEFRPAGRVLNSGGSLDGNHEILAKYIISNGRGFQWVAANARDRIRIGAGDRKCFALTVKHPKDELNTSYQVQDINEPTVTLEIHCEVK